MYGKIFDSIYDGTLAEDWRALITFQQMIVLCDADGMIDMTPHAISRRTGIPIEHIEAGIKILENPDPYSRTDADEGRRIMRIDSHRPWGWHIVNHTKYKNLQDSDMIRAQTRERVRKHREAKKNYVTDGNVCNGDVTDGNAKKRHTDTDTDTDTNTEEKIKIKPIREKPEKTNPQETTHLPDWVDMAAWSDFVTYRKELKKPLKNMGVTRCLSLLEKYKPQQREIIDRSIQAGWTGLFEPKQKQKVVDQFAGCI